MPIKKAARIYNIDRHTVQQWLRRATGLISQPRKHRVPDEQKLVAIKQVESGISVPRVAEAFNVTDQTAFNWVKNKTRILAVNSIQGLNLQIEGTDTMPRSADAKDIKLQNRSLKEENEFLKAKVAYLEELMKPSNIPAGNFKRKLVMKPLTEQLKEEQEK